MYYNQLVFICYNDTGGDNQQEGLAGYRLGNAYEEIGDPGTAILVRTVSHVIFIHNI